MISRPQRWLSRIDRLDHPDRLIFDLDIARHARPIAGPRRRLQTLGREALATAPAKTH